VSVLELLRDGDILSESIITVMVEEDAHGGYSIAEDDLGIAALAGLLVYFDADDELREQIREQAEEQRGNIASLYPKLGLA